MAIFISPVKVSFFHSLSVNSFTRQHLLSASCFDALCGTILQTMRPDEHFACFSAEAGQVVALDKNGHFVRL